VYVLNRKRCKAQLPSHWVLVGRPEKKKPLARPRHRWEDNIQMDLQEVGWGRRAWTGLI